MFEVSCFIAGCLMVVGIVKIYARFRDNVTASFLANVLKRQPTKDEIAKAEREAEIAMAQVPGLGQFPFGGNIL